MEKTALAWAKEKRPGTETAPARVVPSQDEAAETRLMKVGRMFMSSIEYFFSALSQRDMYPDQ